MKFLSIHFLSFEHSRVNVCFITPSLIINHILELYNRPKPSKDENSLQNKKILFTKILPLFTFVHYAKRDFELFFISSKRTPSLFHGVCPDGRFFCFFILDACALQKHGISLSITILKLYIH